MFAKVYLIIVEYMLTKLMSIASLVGYNDRVFMDSCFFLKLQIDFVEDSTFRWLSYLLFPFLIFSFLSYSQPPV